MNDVLFILKQAVGHILTSLCGIAVGIGMCKLAECVDRFYENFYENLKKRGEEG